MIKLTQDLWDYLKFNNFIWKDYSNIPKEERNNCVIKNNDELYLPKFFALNHSETIGDLHFSIKEYIDAWEMHNQNLIPIPEPSNIIVDSEPREEQKEVFEVLLNYYQEHGRINGIIQAAPGFGKEQPYSEPVLTPQGWSTMGALKCKDYVIDANGKRTQVLEIYEQGEKDVYEIKFNDGSTTRCGLWHLWKFRTKAGTNNQVHNYEVATLKEIFELHQNHTIIEIPLYRPELEVDKFYQVKLRTCVNNISKVEQEELVDYYRKMGYFARLLDNGFFEADFRECKHITKITKLNYKENSRCIVVDNPEHLYITKDYTVTHNTYLGIKLSSILNLKTLVIIPNDILEEQWIDSITKFSNLNREDVGIIQGSDIDRLIKQGQFSKGIVVAKVQSLLSQLKTLDLETLQNLYSTFGLIEFDEAHISGAAEGYAKTSIMFRTNNVLGLTATPYRKGVNEFLLKNSIGDLLYVSEHQNLIPEIFIHCIHIEFTSAEIYRLSRVKDDYILFLATYNMILETKDEYFNYIADWVVYRHYHGYKIATLFSTNKMVNKLNNILTSRGLDAGMILGSTKKQVLTFSDYITEEDFKKFNYYYRIVFPKRKKVPEIKKIKEQFQINSKPIKEDIQKINSYLISENKESIEIISTLAQEFSERDIMKTKNPLTSNFKMLSAGYDDEELSSAIFGSPLIGKVGVIQTLGRITRTCETKNQNVVAHFIFTKIFIEFYGNMIFALTNNIKVQYPTAKFNYEGFDNVS